MSDLHSWKGTWDKAGGGALANTGVHPVDLAMFFFGHPVAVAAATFSLVLEDPHKGDDASTAMCSIHTPQQHPMQGLLHKGVQKRG